MFNQGTEALLRGMVFDYLGFIIAVLTVVQLVWNLFVKE